MTFDWRKATDEDIERHFNPRVAVADAGDHIARFTGSAAKARGQLAGRYDIAYGGPADAGEKMTLDLFPARNADLGSPAPVQVFIHGGFWRALDKSDHSFAALDITAWGIAHISLNYDLCPTVTLDDIVGQMRKALAYVYNHADELGIDKNRIHLAGHSAGAHLAAMLLCMDWAEAGLPADVVKGVAALSGIYEPEAVMHTSVNADLHLDLAMAARNDVIAMAPINKAKMLITVGGDEPEGWRKQSSDYAEVCRVAGLDTEVMIVPGTHHFTVLDAAVTAGTPSFEAIVAQIAAS